MICTTYICRRLETKMSLWNGNTGFTQSELPYINSNRLAPGTSAPRPDPPHTRDRSTNATVQPQPRENQAIFIARMPVHIQPFYAFQVIVFTQPYSSLLASQTQTSSSPSTMRHRHNLEIFPNDTFSTCSNDSAT